MARLSAAVPEELLEEMAQGEASQTDAHAMLLKVSHRSRTQPVRGEGEAMCVCVCVWLASAEDKDIATLEARR